VLLFDISVRAFLIFVVPGDGGSQLLAKLNKPSIVHIFCSNYTEDFFPLWLNIELLTPYVLDCTVDNLRFVF
jgi:lysophospholipase-3